MNNASTDDTEDWALSHGTDSGNRTLQKDCSDKLPVGPDSENRQFLYENTGANIGGAGGFQYGMRRGVELGYDAVSATWGVFAVPLGTPDDVLEVLRDAAKKVIEGDDMVEVLNSRGFENAYLPGPEMKELAIQILADNEEVLTTFGLIDAD